MATLGCFCLQTEYLLATADVLIVGSRHVSVELIRLYQLFLPRLVDVVCKHVDIFLKKTVLHYTKLC